MLIHLQELIKNIYLCPFNLPNQIKPNLTPPEKQTGKYSQNPLSTYFDAKRLTLSNQECEVKHRLVDASTCLKGQDEALRIDISSKCECDYSL